MEQQDDAHSNMQETHPTPPTNDNDLLSAFDDDFEGEDDWTATPSTNSIKRARKQFVISHGEDKCLKLHQLNRETIVLYLQAGRGQTDKEENMLQIWKWRYQRSKTGGKETDSTTSTQARTEATRRGLGIGGDSFGQTMLTAMGWRMGTGIGFNTTGGLMTRDGDERWVYHAPGATVASSWETVLEP